MASTTFSNASSNVSPAEKHPGMPTRQAILEACPRRMRPVMMTSLTIVLAMAPAAMGVGAGAGMYGPLAVAVIGGVISSTLLTLIVVPVAYSLMERWLPVISVQVPAQE
jgi:HAE1 family hydrophobic/amphiphilic exporter-1